MEKNERLLNLMRRLIDRGTQHQFNLLFRKYHEADIAEALESISYERKTQFFNRILTNKTVDVFEEMDVESQIEIIQHFKAENAAELIEKMDKDDAVDLLESLLNQDEGQAKTILGKMGPSDQLELNRLLAYEEHSAGALMTTDFITIPEKLTVKEAIALYKIASPQKNNTGFYLFIVNEYQEIKGVISIRKLLLAPLDGLVKDIRNNYPIKVNVHTDQEDVAKVFQKYRSIILPVVDNADIVLGVITIDDVVDVVVEEASEDILKLSGTSGDDIQSSKLIQGPIWYSLVHRLPWLFVTIIGGLISSYIVIWFSNELSQSLISLSFILSFLPLLMGLAGNIGNQSSTILVRALAINQIESSKKISCIIRECGIGIVIGSVIGIVVSTLVFMISNEGIMAICIGLSIVLNMSLASLIGSALPIALKTLGIDPAVASAPFISTALDVIGQIIYFSTAIMMFYLLL